MLFVPPCCVAASESTPQPFNAPHIFVFGLGYVGLPLAVEMRRRGFAVSGITKSKTSSNLAASQSIHALAMDGHDFESVHRHVKQKLATATHLLSTVPPDAYGDPVLRAFAQSIHMSTKLVWLVSYQNRRARRFSNHSFLLTRVSETPLPSLHLIRRVMSQARVFTEITAVDGSRKLAHACPPLQKVVYVLRLKENGPN